MWGEENEDKRVVIKVNLPRTLDCTRTVARISKATDFCQGHVWRLVHPSPRLENTVSLEGLPAFRDLHVLPIRVRRNAAVAFANGRERELSDLFPTWQRGCVPARTSGRPSQGFLKDGDPHSYSITSEPR